MSVLDTVQYRNVIPAYASLDESALYVIEESERDFAEMMKHIGLTELGVLESTGQQIVYEGERMKNLINTIVEWLKKRWADLQGLFNSALKFFKDKAEEFKTKTQGKKLDKLKKKAEMIKDKEYGKTYEYSEFDNIVNGTGSIWEAINKFQKGINNLQWNYQNHKDDVTATIANDMKEDMDNLKADLMSAFGLSESSKESDIKEAVKNTIRGKEVTINKAYIQKNLTDMFDSATNYGKTAKTVKNQFNVIKKSFDTDINSVKKEKKTVNETILSIYLPYLKFGKNVTAAIAGATVQTIKEKMSIDMRIIMKLMIAKSIKETTTQEAAVAESVTFQTELASLFNF